MSEPAQLPLAARVARIYGEPLIEIPRDLYIPPDALEVILEAFEGPLDLLLYLIRRENLNILDIPMAPLTRQYLEYVEAMRSRNLELAAEYGDTPEDPLREDPFDVPVWRPSAETDPACSSRRAAAR